MKSLMLIATMLLTSAAWAQSIDVKDIDSTNEGSTTIEIKKNKPSESGTTGNQWEITNGDADVEGEAAATAKEARGTWKKACDEWKKEVRNDNKENKVLSLNCGTVACSGDAGSKICNSKASYKIKTKVN